MADIIGRRLGNYRLVGHLGHGGFAEVYLGEHLYLKSEAALKVPLTSPKDEELRQFLQEAQTLVGLRHPNIVRVLEFGEEGAIPFLVMDYAPGGTARHRYPLGTRLPLATTVAYIKQVAAALQYAHNRGIIHRDIKPENILLDFDQHILLSDFGLALFAPSPELLSTQKGSGTLPYMPPEQLQGKPTFASDQYALAVVAYEWLCGRRPFEGDIWALLHQHMYVAPPPLRQVCPDVPAAVEEVILRALAKDPQQRFSSIQAFTLALERASHVDATTLDDDSQITAPLKNLSPSAEVTLPGTKHSRYGSPAQRRVFLTAAPADEAFAARLQANLEARRILVSYDRLIDVPGANQQGALQQEIRDALIALVVVSPHTRSSRIIKEQVRVISMYQRHLVFVWAAGDDIAAVLPEAWGRTAMIDLVDAREERYRVALDEIIAFLEAEVPTRTPEESTLPEPPGEPRNPYKGLRAFTRDDAADFFGRDALIEELTETLEGSLTAEQHNVPAARLLTVLGPSGSGKSSVVMAGLLPGLQKGALPGSEAWVYLDPIVPGKRPLESLILTFAPHLPERSLRAIRHDLEDDSARGLHLLATQLVRQRPGHLSPGQGSRLVLVIDQFEELFTQTESEQERQRCIDLLVAAVSEPVGPVIVLVTLRADFYDRPMYYPQLSQLIEAHHKAVLPMNLRDLRAVIEQPVTLPDVQLLFEDDLVGDLLFEAQGQAGALPLLEFTLDQLFQQRDGHWLTRKAYLQIGGVKGALAKHAESTYASLPSDQHRRLVRALFLRLIDPGMTEQDTTRRRAALSELSLPNPKQTAIMREAADAFVAARLLMTNEVAGTTTIEVSHEALIREWARLTEWLREAREDITLQQAIGADAAEWVRRSRPVDRLYRGAQLTEAQVWAERNVPNADEVDFLHAGAVERQYQEDVALNQRVRELDLQRRVVSRQRMLIAVLTLLLVASIVFASVAQVLLRQDNQDKSSALIAAKNASARALAADASSALLQNQLDLALLLGVEATKTDQRAYEARDSLLSALEYSPHIITILRGEANSIGTLAFSPDGRTLLSSDGYSAFIWDTQRGTGHSVLLKGKPLRIGSAALSPDGQTLVTSYADGVWFWNIQTGERQTQLAGMMQNLPADLIPTTTVAFSRDGTLVASGRCSQYSPNGDCLETSISVWKVASTQPIGTPSVVIVVHADVNSIAFSPDDRLLASSSQTGIQLWNLATGQSRGSVLTGSAGTNSIAFSPNGTILAAGCNDKTVRLWNAASGQPTSNSPFTGHTDAVDSVAFSPSGKTLVSGSADGSLRLWDVASGQTITTFTSDTQAKTSVAFSPDGKMLASGSADGTVILWNADPEQSAINRRLADSGGLRNALFSPDGKIVFTGNENGQVLLQDANTGKLLATLSTSGYPLLKPNNAQNQNLYAIESLALSSDGSILVAGRLDGTITLWNWKTRKPVGPPIKHPALLYKIALSSNGHILASGGDGGTIMLWNVAKRALIRSFHITYRISGTLPIALSPDGSLLAAGSCAKNTLCQQPQVLLWKVATGNPFSRPLLGHQYDILDVAFSPKGHILASSSADGIKLWDVSTETPMLLGTMQPVLTNDSLTDYYDHLLFSADGNMLASYSTPGAPFSFALWDVTQRQPFAQVFSEADSFQGSVAFSPDGQKLATVFDHSGTGVFLLWDITIPAWQDHACAIANRNLTADEWALYVKNGARIKVCPKLPLDP